MENQSKIKLYVADSWSGTIKEIEADRISESSYWIGKSRFALKTNNEIMFLTHKEAKDYLIEYHANKIVGYEKQITEHEKIINNLLQLRDNL